MTSKKKEIEDIDPSVIRDYLKRHADFLVENPELFTVLTPPDRSTNDEIVDFQTLMIEKIKSNIEELKFSQGHLIDTSRNNLTTQVQVHEAVLSLLDIHDSSQLGHIVTQDWTDNLHIDVIRICFEKGHSVSVPDLKEISRLSKGCVDEYLGKDDIVQLRGNVEVSEEIFGPAKSLIRAEALVKLPETEHNPPGILAFGSRDADMFYPGQGTELLRFLGKSFHKCLIQWLKRQN